VLYHWTGVEDRQSTFAAHKGRLLGHPASCLNRLWALDTPRVGVTSCHPGLLKATLTVGCQGRLCASAVTLSTTCTSGVVNGHALLRPAMAVRCPSCHLFRRSLCRRGWFPFTGRQYRSDSKIPVSSNGSSWLRFAGGQCLAPDMRPSWEAKCRGKIRSGDVLILLREEMDGVHWACLVVPGAGGADFTVFLPWEKLDAVSARLRWLVTAAGLCRFCLLGELRRGLELAVGSNGDLVWLGLCLGLQNGDSVWLGLSFEFGGGVEFPLVNPRCRVAGNGRIARGLALEEIRWDAASRFFLSSSCGDEGV
jgi:hypothetical protein